MWFKSSERSYLKADRLADVMALIQVLALDKNTHRSEHGLNGELQGPPNSAENWQVLAAEHPEFFRVRRQGTNIVSLVARHVLPKEPGGENRPQLPTEYTGRLLQSAIELHDRQIRRKDRWTYLVPIWVAVIGACTVIAKTWIEAGNGAPVPTALEITAPIGAEVPLQRVPELPPLKLQPEKGPGNP